MTPSPHNRALFSVISMLTVSPFVAVLVLVCWNPERWGGSANPLVIFAMSVSMSVFAVATVPLWPTYFPAIVATPFIMRRVASLHYFRSWPLWIILGLAFILGTIAGVAVISIIVPWGDSLDLILNWIAAGAVSGGVTLVLISSIYRYEKPAA